MAASAEIYFEHDRWGRALAWSAGMHIGVTVFLLIYSAVFYHTSGEGWGSGGGGEAIGATLVSTVPLPASPTQNQNVLANESKGITKSEPKIEEKVPVLLENGPVLTQGFLGGTNENFTTTLGREGSDFWVYASAPA